MNQTLEIDGLSVDISSFEVETLPEQISREQRDTPLEKRRIIAWDGEGMKLSGNDRPQHYVLFGCSAEIHTPLLSRNLGTMQLLEYIVSVGERYPNAVHVGYGFRYDAWMIVKGLPEHRLRKLKEKGEVKFKVGTIWWRIHVIPGKTFRVTKRWSTGRVNKGKRSGDGYVSVKIDDMASFFACPFLDACDSILRDYMSDEDRAVIEHGKLARKDNVWEDLESVRYYWKAEIRLMQQMAERFREVMFAAGLKLREWYGPGAIASYLIRTKRLREHIQNEPEILEVHQASKVAYAGGRFELFQMGRVTGPVYGLDINSAYPYALSTAPSLGRNHGEWTHIQKPRSIDEFGVYRISYRHKGAPRAIEHAAMPLFFRDYRGSISFPQVVHGWYWSPEARAALAISSQYPNAVTIHEGWVWNHDGTRPFEFLQDMFDERMRLGKKNVMSMPYKLGPNSMYGKFAQRVGWDQKNNLPPKSHCLPLAGWITSHCRAQLFQVMAQIPMDKLIAVETDGIYTTADPDGLKLGLGSALGNWDAELYSEMLYLQNGIYHREANGEWKPPKARGLDMASVSREVVASYLAGLEPGEFGPLHVKTRERFIGLNAAYVRGRGIAIKEHLGKWEAGERDIIPGGKGKRVHVPRVCIECASSLSPWETPHRLAIKSRSMGEMSTPHNLPWENVPVPEEMELMRELDIVEADMPYAL